MTFKETDRSAEFRKDVERVFDGKRITEVASRHLMGPAERFVNVVLQNAPEGTTAPIGGRPSQRIWGQTFAASWASPVTHPSGFGEKGAVVQIPLDHPSVEAGWTGDILDWLIHGTPAHIINGRPLLGFWWGSPLRWDAKDGGSPGPRVFSSVGSRFVFQRGYWASPGFDFVNQAAFATDDDFLDARDEAADEILNDPLEDSDFLRRQSGE